MRSLLPTALAALALVAGCGYPVGEDAPGESASAPRVARWQPAPGTTWEWQVSGNVDTSYDVAMYDLDLFDARQSTIDALRKSGRAVVCYFSAGTYEVVRPDAAKLDPVVRGKQLPSWRAERWLDIRSEIVRKVMLARLDLAVSRRCDAVEPDNVDAYQNDSGFPITAQDQLAYNRFLAAAAHARGLSVGLKNATGLARELEPSFDWALSEQCLEYRECHRLAPFVDANKAVFHVEYVDGMDRAQKKAQEVCAKPERAGFSTLLKTLELGPERYGCP
jgi:hypothetical protein